MQQEKHSWWLQWTLHCLKHLSSLKVKTLQLQRQHKQDGPRHHIVCILPPFGNGTICRQTGRLLAGQQATSHPNLLWNALETGWVSASSDPLPNVPRTRSTLIFTCHTCPDFPPSDPHHQVFIGCYFTWVSAAYSLPLIVFWFQVCLWSPKYMATVFVMEKLSLVPKSNNYKHFFLCLCFLS